VTPSGPSAGRTSETANVSRTAEQPNDKNDDEDNSQYPANAIRTTAGVIATPIISEPTTKEDDQQNNYENQFHDEALLSIVPARLSLNSRKISLSVNHLTLLDRFLNDPA
jgi:hypothetical protein